MDSDRIDKWLWCVRVFKSRSLAADSCKSGRVYVNDSQVKPSREIKVNDVVKVRRPPITFSFKVLAFPNSRVGAKLVADYMLNITPQEELQKLDPSYAAFNLKRDRGTGRPTKKERRSLDEIFESGFDESDWDDVD